MHQLDKSALTRDIARITKNRLLNRREKASKIKKIKERFEKKIAEHREHFSSQIPSKINILKKLSGAS